MDDKHELATRRRAIRLVLKGLRPCDILKQISRGRTWLCKWQKRFERDGWDGLQSRSRQPNHCPQSYPQRARSIVCRVRCALQRRQVGLVGPRAVQQEIQKHHLLHPIPGLTSIKRWLKDAGLVQAAPPDPPAEVYYPEPSLTLAAVLHAMDWTSRYLTGGAKVYAFHTLDQHTHALHQTISPDKTAASWRQHVLETWQTLGLPEGLQLDNDTAASGGEKTPRRFSWFVRLCLYCGVEPIFIPPREPTRNGLVERLNGLWAHSFWERDQFRSVAEVKRKSQKFTQWYADSYHPPSLDGLTPAQAQQRVRRRFLTRKQIKALPEELPITAGRVHFLRRVGVDGTIRVLGERWKIGQRLAHRYVWATIVTHCHRLEVYHQRSARSAMRLIKSFAYEMPETVRRLRPEYKR